MTSKLSSKIGPYNVLRRLGGGGMGDVHVVRHERTGREYALKTLKAGGPADGHARFSREARLLASLGHPGIVAVHDFDLAADPPWLVTDLLKGQDLGEALASRGPFPLDEALRLFRGIADAVSAAHESGVLHRDIKPANVFLVENGARPILLDFGLAKPTADDATVLTATGVTMGTPAYMSPEQARGDAVDERADVYSLAATLFEMLTGRAPFEGGSAVALLARILLEPPPPISSVSPVRLPEELDEIFARALAKSKEARTASVAELVAELSPWMQDTATTDSLARGLIPATRHLSSVRPPAPSQANGAPIPNEALSQQDIRPARRRVALLAGAVLLVGAAAGILIATGAFEARQSAVAPLAVTNSQVESAAAPGDGPSDREADDPRMVGERRATDSEGTNTDLEGTNTDSTDDDRASAGRDEETPSALGQRGPLPSMSATMTPPVSRPTPMPRPNSMATPRPMNHPTSMASAELANAGASGPPTVPYQAAIDAMAESDFARCIDELDRLPPSDRTLQILFNCAIQTGNRVTQERACMQHQTMYPRHPFSEACRNILDAQ